jgi:hypothetical protein
MRLRTAARFLTGIDKKGSRKKNGGNQYGAT